jgi:hypothetical protein
MSQPILPNVLSLLSAAFGSGSPSLSSGRVRLRYEGLAEKLAVDPNGKDALVALMARAGVKIVSPPYLIPLTLTSEPENQLLATGELAGATMIIQGRGVGFVDVIEIEVYETAALAAENREAALFIAVDKIFSGKNGGELLARYIGYTIEKRSREQAKVVLRGCANAVADYMAN